MEKLSEINDKIKALKTARDILKEEYSESDFHKKKEANPQSIVPPVAKDAEIYKLLTAIQQLDQHIKKLQDQQFDLLKKEEKK